MATYYNEFDKKKAAMLRSLIEDGQISPGVVDDRPIQEVEAKDLYGYNRVHFFAGIGLWDYALTLSKWPDDRIVWTGSCPCQPFSSAGRQKGKSDERHLWPVWERLIAECLPPTVFGEQVNAAITQGWLDDVYKGLEPKGYAIAAAVLPACSVGAPHRRERLWFVGHSEHHGLPAETLRRVSYGDARTGEERSNLPEQLTGAGSCGNVSLVMADPQCEGSQRLPRDGSDSNEPRRNQKEPNGPRWNDGIWIDCPDGKQRLIEPSIPLLADGDTERVGLIHAAGDAIVPQVAAEFITSYLEVMALL